MLTRDESCFESVLMDELISSGHKVFRQFWIARSRADVVACRNGHLHVFEIKSDVDNLDRLPSQLANYFKGSDTVSVLASIKHLDRLRRVLRSVEYGEYVGVFALDSANRVNMVRPPVRNTAGLQNEVLFKMLRKPEYTEVVLSAFGTMPEIPQVFYHKTYMAKFCELQPEIAYALVAQVLEQRVQRKNGRM